MNDRKQISKLHFVVFDSIEVLTVSNAFTRPPPPAINCPPHIPDTHICLSVMEFLSNERKQ